MNALQVWSHPLQRPLMSNGGICTTEDLASGVHCLTRQHKHGLVVGDLRPWVYHLTTIFQVVALSGFISLSAVLFIFTLIAVSNCESSSDLQASKTHSPVEEFHLPWQSKTCHSWCWDSCNRSYRTYWLQVVFSIQEWGSSSWASSPFDRKSYGFVHGEFLL